MYDPKDEHEAHAPSDIPVSAGVPMIVRVSAVVGIIAIFTMIGIVIYASAFGHSWPYSNADKIRL